MKNGLLIWNIALTLIAGYLVFDHFSSGKKEATATKTVSKDPPAANTGFRIAYFDMDSVENNFNMVKKARQEIDGREKKYNNDVAAMEMDRQQRIEGYQKRNMALIVHGRCARHEFCEKIHCRHGPHPAQHT